MARIALKIWSAIISAFAVMAAHAPADASVSEANTELSSITVERSRKPELFLEKAVTASEQNMMVARGGGHASHSSHASHASHASHYSGSTGTSTTSTSTETTPTTGIEKSTSVPGSSATGTPTPAASLGSPKTSRPATGTSGGAGSWNEVKKIVLKDGGSLPCDFAWKDGKSIKVLTNGKVLSFDITEIDTVKTFGQ